MDVKSAIEFVKKQRPFIQPNPGFLRQLEAYEKEINCELCVLEPRTQQFVHYDTRHFRVIECDQCDEIVIVSRKHQVDFNKDEFEELCILASKVGLDFYGDGNW